MNVLPMTFISLGQALSSTKNRCISYNCSITVFLSLVDFFETLIPLITVETVGT